MTPVGKLMMMMMMTAALMLMVLCCNGYDNDCSDDHTCYEYRSGKKTFHFHIYQLGIGHCFIEISQILSSFSNVEHVFMLCKIPILLLQLCSFRQPLNLEYAQQLMVYLELVSRFVAAMLIVLVKTNVAPMGVAIPALLHCLTVSVSISY